MYSEAIAGRADLVSFWCLLSKIATTLEYTYLLRTQLSSPLILCLSFWEIGGSRSVRSHCEVSLAGGYKGLVVMAREAEAGRVGGSAE